MREHIWGDPAQPEVKIEVSEEGKRWLMDGLPLGPTPADPFAELVGREILRLADRVWELEAHQAGIRQTLRAECSLLGDNDWPDNLHLADVVEKHLCRPFFEFLNRVRDAAGIPELVEDDKLPEVIGNKMAGLADFVRVKEAENAALREAARSQAKVINDSINPNGTIWVNVNAVVGAALRLEWAAGGDFSWMNKD